MKLYFSPLACSLASRIACLEAGLEVDYLEVSLLKGRITKTGTPFSDVTLKQKVPVLETDDGELLTESAAVLQYIADHGNNDSLAPAPGTLERYRLQELLSFVGTELHKGLLYPLFQADTPKEVKAYVHTKAPIILNQLAQILEGKTWAMGETFTLVDGYLSWALYLCNFAGFALPDTIKEYVERLKTRPSIAKSIAIEMQLWQVQQDQLAKEKASA
ncbi:glutathione S-transferase N-terminal domain-containing protein [Sneathiella limimaris]|uniref:glutathione S-transferase N-terminal domain-containing protein n=1 Tax=Sneathiella limimaris TaxID=1964213 RepID=UPI00146CF1A8|nr:glutathione S-transferase N-terminal domain-containing protein [Sneathiella limimaris]